MPIKTTRYRYRVDLQIKSTNKKEVIEELETLLELVKSKDNNSCGFGGDSGSCYSDCNLTKRANR